MSEAIEIEYKSLLTKDEYQRLIHNYLTPADTAFSQTNLYYDTPDFQLKQQQMGLRIRLLPTSAELTLKSPLATGEGLLETTDSLSLAEAEALVAKQQILQTGQVVDKLATVGILPSQLVCHGQLTTKRVERQLTSDVLLVLDESWYHGQHDYELEMEVSDAHLGKAYFVNFLLENAIEYKLARNKIVRTLEAKMSN